MPSLSIHDRPHLPNRHQSPRRRQHHPDLEDMHDYPMSTAYWRDAYRRGTTPYRPPGPPRDTADDDDLIPELLDRIAVLEAQAQERDRTIAQLVAAARARESTRSTSSSPRSPRPLPPRPEAS